MKKLSLMCCTVALSLTTALVLCKKQRPKTNVKVHTHHPERHGKKPVDLDEEAIIVLGHFAGIVSSFFTLLQAPRDTNNVGRSLGDMVDGLVNIISTAVRKGKKLENHVQTPEFKKEIAKLFVKRIRLIEPTDHELVDSK